MYILSLSIFASFLPQLFCVNEKEKKNVKKKFALFPYHHPSLLSPTESPFRIIIISSRYFSSLTLAHSLILSFCMKSEGFLAAIARHSSINDPRCTHVDWQAFFCRFTLSLFPFFLSFFLSNHPAAKFINLRL
jgi:hypothetical protein